MAGIKKRRWRDGAIYILSKLQGAGAHIRFAAAGASRCLCIVGRLNYKAERIHAQLRHLGITKFNGYSLAFSALSNDVGHSLALCRL